MDMSLSKLQEVVKDREAYMLQSKGSQRVRYDWAIEQQQQQQQHFRASKKSATSTGQWQLYNLMCMNFCLILKPLWLITVDIKYIMLDE